MINEAERQKLNLFMRHIDNMRNLAMVNKPIPAPSLRVSILPGYGVSARVEGLNKDDFRSALLAFRQFCDDAGPDDPRFYAVCSTVEKIGIADKRRDWVRKARENWAHALRSYPSHYALEGRPLSVQRCMKIYFNGVLFHSDIRYAAIWDSLDDDFKAAVEYSIRAVLPRMFWSLNTVDIMLDSVLDNPEREIPNLPADEVFTPL